jgi:predicted dienelactone hydrolase
MIAPLLLAALAPTMVDFPTLQDPARGGRKLRTKVHLPSGKGPFPVVIFSHGGGGHWDANFAQANDLARHGYAVMCPEHPGSNTAVLTKGRTPGKNLLAMTRDADELINRPKDIHFLLDEAIKWNRTHPQLKGKLDIERVGVAGHSYGAYTALVVGSVRVANDWMVPGRSPGLAPSMADHRVKAIVALSPQGPGEPFFREDSYSGLTIPALGISGSEDGQQGIPASNRKRGFALWPKGDKTLVWLTGADHNAFSDPTGSGSRSLPSKSRADAQPIAQLSTRLFFDHYLKGDTAALKTLRDPATYSPKGAISAVEVLVR